MIFDESGDLRDIVRAGLPAARHRSIVVQGGRLRIGRRGETVTAESTGSYALDISSLMPALRKGQRVTATIPFSEGTFLVLITVDTSNPWNAFVELVHETRDE